MKKGGGKEETSGSATEERSLYQDEQAYNGCLCKSRKAYLQNF